MVEVVADRAQRSLIVFRQTAAATANSVKASFRGLDGLLGSFAGFFTGLQFKRLADGILKASMTAETFKVQMNLIVRDMAKVQDLTTWMTAYEVKTPFNLPEIQQATVLFTKLTKIRGEDLGKAKEYITLAGEMASIFNKPLAKATEGLFKTLSGSALGLTILRNNFAITKAELEKFGVAFDQSGRIKNFQMQIGAVEHAIKSIVGHLGNMQVTEARAQTLQGRLESLHSQIFAVSVLMGDKLAPIAMVVVNRMIETSQAIQDLIKKYPMMANAIAIMVGFGAVLGTLLVALGPIIFFGNQLIGMIMGLSTAIGGTSLLLRMFQATLLPVGAGIRAIIAIMTGGATAFASLGAVLASITTAFAEMAAVMAAAWEVWLTWAATEGVLTATLGAVGALTMEIGAMGLSAATAVAGFVSLRSAVYGVAGVAVYALLKLKELTDYLNTVNETEDQKVRDQDPQGFARLREKLRGGSEPDATERNLKHTNESIAAQKSAARARLSALTPEERALANRFSSLSSQEMQDQKDMYTASSGKLGGAVTDNRADALRKMIVDAFDMAKSKIVAGGGDASDERVASKASAALNWSPGFVTQNGGWADSDQILAAVQAQKQLVEQKKRQVDQAEKIAKLAKAEQDLIRSDLAAISKVIQIKKDEEALNLGRKSAEDYQIWFTELKRKHTTEIITSKQTFEQLAKMRKEALDEKGKPRKGFEDLLKKTDTLLHDTEVKSVAEIVAAGNSKLAENPDASIRDKINANKAMQEEINRLVRTRAAALNEGKAKSDWVKPTYTGAEAKAGSAKQKENAKLELEIWQNQQKAEREITGFTQSEFAKRREELEKHAAEWKKQGLLDVQIAKKRSHELIQIATDESIALAEIDRRIADMKADAAQTKLGTRISKAESDIANGGTDFEELKAAREANDAAEDMIAKNALTRAIQDEKDKAAVSVLERSKSEKVIAALKEKFDAEQAKRDEDRRQRNINAAVEVLQAEKDATRSSRTGAIKVKGYDAQLTQLQAQQEASGVDNSEQIIQVLKNRYQTEIAMITKTAYAAAEKAKAAGDMEEALAIEQEKTQAILDLTRSTTAEVQKQIDLKKAAEDKKKNSFFFAQGTMSAEEYDKMDKARSDDMRSKYKQSVLREQMRTGGVSKETRDAANKLGVDSNLQNAAFNPNAVEIKPIDINVKVDLVDPNGKTTTVRKATSTEAKNTQTKNSSTQRGKPWDFRPTEGYPEGVA